MKRLATVILALVLILAMTGTACAELKGPGNVTLKRLGYNIGFDVNADYMVPIIKEATGYDVEYFSLPAENADEKLLMEVAGGADYDVVNISMNQWRTLLAQGALLPLNDLLEEYGKDIYDGNSADVWGALTGEDGNIYGVPYCVPHPREINSFMPCRLDLMKAAGVETLPTTIDEFYECLKTLKDYYGDEYIIFTGPIRTASEGHESWVIPRTLACAFGISSDWMVDDEGKVYYMTEAEGFADMISFLSKLYNEGLIDPDWAVNTENTVMEKFSSGKAIISCSNRACVQQTTPAQIELLGITYDDVGYISALKGSDGTCTFEETKSINQVSCILRSSKNPEDAMNWMNLKVQNQLFICIGVEGVHFNYDEEGMIAPINPIFADERGDSYWYIDCTNADDYEFQWPSRIRKSDAQWAAFSAVTLVADDSIFVENHFKYMPASEAYSKYNTALFNSLQDFILQVMAGARTIDDLETFKADWTNNGGEDVRAELQAYIDSQA